MSTWTSIFNNTSAAIRQYSNKLARLQEQASSGSRVVRSSDAPADAFKIMDLRSQSESLSTYRSNIDAVSGNLKNSWAALQDISKQLATGGGSVRVILTQAASGIQDAKTRAAMAGGIETLLEHIIATANTKILGQYIFSGSKATRPAYQAVRDNSGKIVTVNYTGGHDEMAVPVAPGVNQGMTLSGDRIFRSNNRQQPVFMGNTGAAAGSGTDSVRGDVWLTARHDSTVYQAGSGLAAGTDAAGDTVLGQHTLHVDGPAGTVRLDDGPSQNFDGSETNLTLTNAAGDVVHLDATGFNMTTAGDFSLTGEGSLSIDNGAAWTAIDFADGNQAVVDSATGRTLYVDSRNISRAGVDPIRIPGTYDLFNTLINVRDLLGNTRNLSDQRQRDLIDEAIASVDEVSKGLAAKMASVGSRQQAMDGLANSLEDLNASTDDQASLLQDADIVQVSIDLSRTQILYEMSLKAAAKMLSTSLLNFI